MIEKFHLKSLHHFQKNPNIFFSNYLKKNNEKIELDEPVCTIRIGNYNSFFPFEIITVKSKYSGFLIQEREIDESLIENDLLFSISPVQQIISDLKVDETLCHYFPGQNNAYTFGSWLKRDNSYVTIGEPVYSYSKIRLGNRTIFAEKSGKIKFSEPRSIFLAKNQLMYKINYSEPFKAETFETEIITKNIETPCYVYLMKDYTNGFYKIGISNNPEYREKTLQSEKPSIDLIASKEFPLRLIAESFEKALHKTFENKRLRGEWFNLDEIEANYLKKSLE